jgi:D-amino-acid oxidase
MSTFGSNQVDRRGFLAAGGAALANAALSACMPRRIATAVPPAPGAATGTSGIISGASNLAVPRISWDRVIRTTVGLRPHRESGFVLRAEKFDDKTVIHDYGFGGAGMSLAWGCGAMVADIALDQATRRAAVLGCGSPGLTAARQLQRRGFEVTIYAMAIPPDTTSNMSWAGFTPTSGLVTRRSPEWDAQFRRAAEISYRELQLLVDHPGYGVYWIDTYAATDIDPRSVPGNSIRDRYEEGGDLLPQALWPERDDEILGPGEHPFPTKYVIRSPSLGIEPNLYLDRLVRDFMIFGGKIVIRKFDTVRDLMSLPESLVVNCTGLGSKTLFNDNEIEPIKGQLTLCVPQPELNYRVSGRLSKDAAFTDINPRSDGIVVGNMRDRGNWSLEPNMEVRQQNMDAAIQFCAAMRPSLRRGQLMKSSRPSAAPSLGAFSRAES